MTLITIYEIYEVHNLLGRNLQYNLVIKKLVILICYNEYIHMSKVDFIYCSFRQEKAVKQD